MFVKYSLLFFVATLNFSYCQKRVRVNSCPKFTLMENFTPLKAVGVWYAHEIGDKNEAKKACLKYDLELKEEDVIMHKSWTDGTNIPQTEDLKMTLQNGSSKLIVYWPPGMVTFGWVIYTDYKSYSIWYLCIPKHENQGMVFVGTRDRNPKPSLIEEIHKEFYRFGFDVLPSSLLTVNQTNCNN